MPWEKKFDTEAALEKAMQVFWAKGYAATSLSDLTAAMGINKGSLYNAYGGKEKLFVAVITKYDLDCRRRLFASLDALDDPVEAIIALFEALIEESLQDDEAKGCFLVNTALEFPFHGPLVQQVVTSSLRETEAFFQRMVARGQNRGQISRHVNPEEAAKGLLTLVMGLRVLARGAVMSASLPPIKKQALCLLGLGAS